MKNLLDIQNFQQFNKLEFIARQVVEGFITGLHRSPFHGFSVEFAEHRLYNSGESTKHIDWKLYAKTDKLFVKRYEEETNLRCNIVIDTSSSMLFPYKEKSVYNKLFFSVYCSAALIHLMRKQRDAVGLSLFSENVDLITDTKVSDIHSKRLYNELEKLLAPNQLEAGRKTSTAKALHQIAESSHKRSLIIIFSDMMDDKNPDELFSAMQHLRYKKHEVVLFHVTDHQHEHNFEFTNRPYKFIDLESKEEVKLTPTQIKDEYIKQVEKYYKEVRLKCMQYKIDFVDVDINKDFNEVLMPFLIKRSKLY